MNIRRIGPEDWEIFRDVRLAALREAPYAFGSTFQGEVGGSEESWRHRLTDRARLVAEVDGQVVGTVSAGAGEFAGTTVLTALWVDPSFRGQGFGSALVDAVVAWAGSQGCSKILLWVTDVNKTAERLYERHGFTRTGRMAKVRPGQPAGEHEMAKPL